jgi:protein-disulfide isomerase
MVKRGHEIDLEYSKKTILDRLNSYLGYNAVEKLKFISFESEELKLKDKITKNVTNNEYKEKISKIKNDKVKKSLIELSKYFKKKMKKIILVFSIIFFYFGFVLADKKIKPIYEGNIDSKVNILVYESLTCSHCAEFHKEVYPKLKKDFIDNGLAKIEFRSFPLDLAALNASKIAHCKNDGKSDLLHFLFENQKKWVRGETIEDINKHLKSLVLKNEIGLDFESCLLDKNIEDHVLNDRINGVKKFNIDSTPTLIINDKKFDNPNNYKKLKKNIEKLI